GRSLAWPKAPDSKPGIVGSNPTVLANLCAAAPPQYLVDGIGKCVGIAVWHDGQPRLRSKAAARRGNDRHAGRKRGKQVARSSRENRRLNDGGDVAEPGVRIGFAGGAMDAHAAPERWPLEFAAEQHHVEVKLLRDLPHLEGARAGNRRPWKSD